MRTLSRLHELHGLLALAAGRYELVPAALRAAVEHGTGTFLAAELERLRTSIGPEQPIH
ncbi:hypothetical protein [Kitasatospora sp. NPDC086791]|uniref:hypothetical protein n=1 Tax=Kitasatospora sp. NPDC086791 TaxID=3155178 RepID=UPI003414A87C